MFSQLKMKIIKMMGKSNGGITCGRCGKTTKQDDFEICWYCNTDLCGTCWNEFGHCGHKEAEMINEYARNFDPDNPPMKLGKLKSLGSRFGLLLKIRFFLIRWLASNDLQLAINCEVRGELILKRGYPGWVSDCLFTLADT